jgi:oligosaccharide repeat unit polymerase
MNPTAQARQKQPLLFIGLSALLMIALAEAIFGGSSGPEFVIATILGVPAIWLMLRLWAWMIRKIDNIDLFSPIFAFPVAYVLWFGFASVNVLDEQNPIPYVYILIGLVSYMAGVWFFGDRKQNGLLSRPTCARSDWNPRSFWTVIAFLVFLTVTSYLYLVSHIGIPALSAEAGEQRLQISNYGVSEAIFLTSGWTLMVFLPVHLRLGEKKRTRRWLAFLLLAVVCLMLPSLGSRGFLFLGFLTALIACYYIGSRLRFGYLVLVSVCVFAGLSLYGYIRDSALSQGYVAIGGGDSLADFFFPLYYAYEYVRGPVVTFRNVTQLIPREIPFQYGALTFGALRTLLPGHHEMADIFFKKIQGHDFIGLGEPATLLGPLYGDFGLPGIVIGLFSFGALSIKVYQWMSREPTAFRVIMNAWLAQTALLSLFGDLFPYINTLWMPLFWYLLHLWMRNDRQTFAELENCTLTANSR